MKFELKSIGDIATVTKLAGFEYSKHFKYVEDGEIIAIRAMNVKNGILDLKNVKRIKKDISDNLQRSKLFKGDIVLTYTGAKYGQSAMIRESDKFHLAPNVAKVTVDNPESAYFVYLVMQSKNFINQLYSHGVGSTQPTIPMRAIRELRIVYPPLIEQNKISKFTYLFNKKIELNDFIISNIKELSQTLFKRWFVDFEFPNKEGKPYKSSGGKMIESELGMIPDGWKVKSLSEVANFQNGLAMQKFRPKEDEESLPVLKIKELRQGFTDTNSDLCSINIKDSVKVYDGDVIFSWSATLLVKLWVGGDAGLNQHLFKVTSTDHSKWFYYLWTKHYLDIFNALAKDKATTMGHIKRSHLDESKVIIPTQKYYDYFDSVFNEITDQKVNLLKENKSLAELRDTLLPKLLSGEIELPDDMEVTDDVPIS